LSNADGYDKETGTVDIPEKWRKASLDGQMHIEMIKENGEGEKECVISFLYREDSNGVTRIVYDSEDSVNHLCKTVPVFDYVARIEPNWFVY